MNSCDLSKCKWSLRGWQANAWRLVTSVELNQVIPAEVGPIPARVPGSIQAALRRAGLLPDWNVAQNSYACEWVESRHWELSTTLPARWIPEGQTVRLHCEGLDCQGVVLIDRREVGRFSDVLRPWTFDLTGRLTPGQSHELSIIFEGAPDEQGQFGWSSASRHLKPRFAYRWDWCPRIVPLGPWDRMTLEVGNGPRLVNVRPVAQLEADFKTGGLKAVVSMWSAAGGRARLHATLKRGGRTVASAQASFLVKPGASERTLKFSALSVVPWQPNGQGEAALYDLELSLQAAPDEPAQTWAGRVGFKHVRWQPCEGAPRDALPWLCVVNGQPVFLQGVNWTPIRPNYQDLTRADYVKRLRLYKKMGCNVLRVWGGGLIERCDFYELCDELGLMVWQEFPLSSSGLENMPPSDPAVIERITAIARSAIERRGGHASLLMWCGGNELSNFRIEPQSRQRPEDVRPCDGSGPCLAALGRLVRTMMPGVRFLPTSPYGPRFNASAQEFGKGVHHMCHGPWKVEGTLEQWYEYWDGDDTLLRPETGAPGAEPLDLLERYRGECDPWPPRVSNPYWRHSGTWWIEWERFEKELAGLEGREGVARYVQLSQRLQARALAHAAAARKRKFPRTAGILIWMGHDCFPCPANTSVVDFEGRPKPAARALAKIFNEKPDAKKR